MPPAAGSSKRRLFLPDDVMEAIFNCLEEQYRPKPGVDPILTLRQTQPFSYVASTSPFAPALHDQYLRVFYSISLVCRQWHALAQEYLYKRIWISFPKDFERLLACITDPDELENIFAPGEGAAAMGHNSRDASPAGRSPRRMSLEGLPNPGLFIRSLSFEKFRTSGLGRSIGEGSQHRFVTPTRVLKMLQGTRPVGSLDGEANVIPWRTSGRLRAVGFTEYMDSSLTIEVLKELLLRGGFARGTYRNIRDGDRLQLEGSELARNIAPIRALDFCGCISRRFISALEQLIQEYELDHLGSERRILFPHLKRLGLFDAGSIKGPMLTSFISSFPNLTHLDLAKTRASPQVLTQLSVMPIQLKALSLMRCSSLPGDAIVDFFCGPGAKVTSELTDLCLGSDETSPIDLDAGQLAILVSTAPCFTSGMLRVLDLSSCPFTDDILTRMPKFTELIVLGLANCRDITLAGLANFLEHRAPTVECLDLTRSCAPLNGAFRPRVGLPFLHALDLHFHLLNNLAPDVDDLTQRPTRLRVIELEERTLSQLGAGVSAWKPIYCGRRCFYVETSLTGQFEGGSRIIKKMAKDDEERRGILKLTEKSTKVGNVGWRPFKMEILAGNGFLGREDGLYAYHAFSI